MAHHQRGKHIIVSAVEHHAVLNSAKRLGRWGFRVSYVPVDKYGMVYPQDVRQHLRAARRARLLSIRAFLDAAIAHLEEKEKTEKQAAQRK